MIIIAGICASTGWSTTFIVAPSGGDFTQIQAAIDSAQAGDTILVKNSSQPYYEKLNMTSSGDSLNGYIYLMSFPGHRPVIDGSQSAGDNLISLFNRSYIHISGFELRNNLNVNDGSGIRISGKGTHLIIRNNIIHDIRGSNAMGITVYGTQIEPVRGLVIDQNEIYDCEPARSEALVLNGNVTDFFVTNNYVHDVNNIGIDFIGGESWINNDSLVVRNGVCRGNRVSRAHASYGGGYAAGIYVDGAHSMTIENNVITECDMGIEIGAENAGIITHSITVRNNLVYGNDKVGIIMGGYDVNTGTVQNCLFSGNSCFKNDLQFEGWGEIVIQYASDNEIRNNIFYSNDQNVLLYSENGNINNLFDYNLWYTENGPDAAEFVWNNTLLIGIESFRGASGQGAHSAFADPKFSSIIQPDLHISTLSPAINFGDPLYSADSNEVDMDSEVRISGGRIDAGADEINFVSIGTSRVLSSDLMSLVSVYPNPFNQSIRIEYAIDVAEETELSIYSVLGHLIHRVHENHMASGSYSYIWDGTNSEHETVSSGVYILKLKAGNEWINKKIMLLR